MTVNKVKGGYKNVQPGTGRTFSKKPMSHKKAIQQLKAIEFSKHNKGKK